MNWKWIVSVVACLIAYVGCSKPSTTEMPSVTPSSVATTKDRPTLEKISTIIADLMQVDKVKLLETTSLADLRCDELDFVEIVMEMEETFGITISDERANELLGSKDWRVGMKNVTLSKLADMVEAELAQKSVQGTKPN